VPGNDLNAFYTAFEHAKAETGKPQLIIARTLIGKGIPEVAGTSKAHGEGGAKFIEAARKALGLTRKTLVSVGLLIERKGHDLIIGAMPDLPDFDLLIAGEGEERDRLQALAAKLGVETRVRLLGSVPHRELQKLDVAADALVLASSREGWPNVLLEAMACGTPVVASNIWGNPEVVAAPEAGVLMPSRDPAGVAEGVKTLFARLPERERTRAFAEHYSWDATTRGQIDLFRNILRKQQAPQTRTVAAALST
jgi:glycosyltransferase involved in cell wall biosynthesis